MNVGLFSLQSELRHRNPICIYIIDQPCS